MPLSRLHPLLRALGLIAALGILSAGCSQSEEPTAEKTAETTAEKSDEPAVVTIDGSAITEADIEMAASDLDPQFARLPEEQRRAATVSALIEIKLLAAAARKKSLHETAEHKRRMAFLADRTLHSATVRSEVADSVTDEAISARYEEDIAKAGSQKEIKVRHILVKTEEEAKAIITELDGGSDFSDLAKDKSTGPSGPSGGELGFIGKGVTVPEFETAAFELEVGAYTKAPVQTQFGWHVIQVDEQREKAPPTLESQKEQIRSVLLRDKYFALVKGLREAAKIEITDAKLKEAIAEIEAQQN